MFTVGACADAELEAAFLLGWRPLLPDRGERGDYKRPPFSAGAASEAQATRSAGTAPGERHKPRREAPREPIFVLARPLENARKSDDFRAIFRLVLHVLLLHLQSCYTPEQLLIRHRQNAPLCPL